MSLKEIDNQHYLEDALLTWKILDVIRASHDLDVEKVFRHCKIAGMEIDAVAVCRTLGDREDRWIGFELKESDIQKAFKQAISRRTYFDYFYIILDLETRSIVNFILAKKEAVEKYKIGFVSAKENVVVYSSRFQKRLEIKGELREEIRDLPLIKYLHEKHWRQQQILPELTVGKGR